VKPIPALIVKKTGELKGTVKAPPSKAYTHRAVIAASLSEGKTIIKNPSSCDDALTTIKTCSALGAKIKRESKDILVVEGRPKPRTPDKILDCRGSGSTIRFISSVCALADGISVLTGNRSLRRRPMQPLLDALKQLGVQCFSTKQDGTPPIIVFGGGIKGGDAVMPGDISSQFVSSLLLSTPKAEKDTEITLTTRLESKPYVKMTIEVLQKHGVKVDCTSTYDRFSVPCRQEYRPATHLIEGDYSAAAFILAASTITKSNVKVKNLKRETLQGDKLIVSLLEKMGATIEVGENYIKIMGEKENLTSVNVDLSDAPDLVPVFAALACYAQGETIIRGVRRLRFKESDRISSLVSELTKMGGIITVNQNSLLIEGKVKLRGAHLSSHGDHRIAMACILAALGAEGETVIHGINCLKKSYPNLVDDLIHLGGKVVGG